MGLIRSRAFAMLMATATVVAMMMQAPVFALAETARAKSKRAPAQKTQTPNSAKAKKKPTGVPGVVKTDGAIVYARPDFDAEVLTTLFEKQKVRISKGTFGQVAKFYKIIVKHEGKSKIGYVADIDVAKENPDSAPSPKESSHQKTAKDEKRDQKRDRLEKKRDALTGKLPMYFSRFIGLTVGQTTYKEGINGVDATEGVLAYGLKATGPDVVMEGPVMDLDVILHYGAPSYYEKLSATKPAGFVLWVDALWLLPLYQAHNSMLYFGVGPLLVLSNFKVTNDDRPMDLTALNVGGSFSLGGGVRVEKIALRLEGKYYWEKQKYQSIFAAVQTEF